LAENSPFPSLLGKFYQHFFLKLYFFSSSYVYISEIFPTSIRGAGMGLVSILEGLAGFFAPYLAFSENYAIVYSLYAAFSLAGW